MTFPKLFTLMSLVLFSAIVVAFFLKKGRKENSYSAASTMAIEFELVDEGDMDERTEDENPLSDGEADAEVAEMEGVQKVAVELEENLPTADRMDELFSARGFKLPIVQTITYSSHVPWLKGRPAWIADYASHYKTSTHFISRSLNGTRDYEKQSVKNGDRFNVFRKDKNFEFYLLVDLLVSKMWLYYVDKDTNERVLLKSYVVGLGRPDSTCESGCLTPMGKYTIGDRRAIYCPKKMGHYQGAKVEMVRVFGTRWIPFGEEISDCTDSPKGYGLHGLPLQPNAKGEFVENLETLGKFESDGCIRMKTEDIEELFAILTRPATIQLIKGFHHAKLPGSVEVQTSSP